MNPIYTEIVLWCPQVGVNASVPAQNKFVKGAVVVSARVRSATCAISSAPIPSTSAGTSVVLARTRVSETARLLRNHGACVDADVPVLSYGDYGAPAVVTNA